MNYKALWWFVTIYVILCLALGAALDHWHIDIVDYFNGDKHSSGEEPAPDLVP